MPRVILPGKLKLHCPHCREGFEAAARQLSQRETLTCPFCSQVCKLYEALDTQERRRVYHAIRDELERLVYNHKLAQDEIKF